MHKAQQALRVSIAYQVFQEHRELLVHKDHKVPKAPKAPKAHQDFKELIAYLVFPVPKV